MVRHLQADSWKIVSAADDKTLKVLRVVKLSEFSVLKIIAIYTWAIDIMHFFLCIVILEGCIFSQTDPEKCSL